MYRDKRTSFKGKLLLGSIIIIALITILLSIGNGAIQRAVNKQAEVREETVQPLAEMSTLQTQIYRIRVTEANLSKINDYFAMAAEVDALNRHISTFQQSLDNFLKRHKSSYTDKLELIEKSWMLITENLTLITQAAGEMNRSEVERISSYQTQPRFNTLIVLMEQLASQIKMDAEQRFQETVVELEDQRTQFLLFSLVAILILIGFFLRFTQYLSGRISYLNSAFSRVSESHIHDPIKALGNDELTDLTHAFNTMQNKVANRENALLKAREELEDRVVIRTNQLQEINFRLQNEVEVRRKAEEDLRVLSLAVSQSPVSVIIARIDGSVDYVNQAYIESSGYSAEEIKGGKYKLLNNLEEQPELKDQLWSAINSGTEWNGDLINWRKDGKQYWEHTQVSPVTDENGKLTHYLIIKDDITEQKEQQKKILYQAHFDSLTELPNRSLAMDRLAQGVARAARANEILALMFIDLDGFKNVNDSLGHDTGDALLVQAAQRLKKSVRQSDTVARLGGDEFLIIMSGLNSRSDCFPVLDKIKAQFNNSFFVGNNELTVTPSIGLSLFPDDGQDGDVLLRNADLAMYQAKEAGRNTYHFFNQEMHSNLQRRMDIEGHLKRALEKKELFLLYQPIISTQNHQLIGLEALIRWNNRKLGRILPDEFISVAEQSGLIIPIGNWVINTAIEQMKHWRNTELGKLSLSINVSPRQIQDQSLQTVINEAVDEHGFSVEQLTLEVTEGLLIRNPLEAQKNLQGLKDLGVQLAMDDFGTGYSSLSNLKNFPFDVLKIDRTFIRDIEDDEDDFALVSAAVSMGRGLDLKIVAEGVETQTQMSILSDMQCDSVQGFYFSKPLTVEALYDWATNYTRKKT